jgi:hypothetical protein
MRIKGTATAAPLEGEEELSKELAQEDPTGVAIYPNPTRGSELHLRMDFEGEVTVTIRDVAGREIRTAQWVNNGGSNELLMEVGNLPSGIYWIETRIGNEAIRKRWVKA